MTKFSLTSTGRTKYGFAVHGKPGELIQPFFGKSVFSLSTLGLSSSTSAGSGSTTVPLPQEQQLSITATSFRRGL